MGLGDMTCHMVGSHLDLGYKVIPLLGIGVSDYKRAETPALLQRSWVQFPPKVLMNIAPIAIQFNQGMTKLEVLTLVFL